MADDSTNPEPLRLPTREDAKRLSSRLLVESGLTPFDLLERTWLLEIWTEIESSSGFLDVDLKQGLRTEVAAALWRKSDQALLVMDDGQEHGKFREQLVKMNIPAPTSPVAPGSAV